MIWSDVQPEDWISLLGVLGTPFGLLGGWFLATRRDDRIRKHEKADENERWSRELEREQERWQRERAERDRQWRREQLFAGTSELLGHYRWLTNESTLAAKRKSRTGASPSQELLDALQDRVHTLKDLSIHITLAARGDRIQSALIRLGNLLEDVAAEERDLDPFLQEATLRNLGDAMAEVANSVREEMELSV